MQNKTSARTWAATFSTALTLLATGCASEYDIVRTRAAGEFACAERTVDVKPTSGRSYIAKGCGRVGTYTCTGSSMDTGVSCDQDQDGPAIPLLAPSGCGKDADCKGDRVCDRGQCVAPPAKK